MTKQTTTAVRLSAIMAIALAATAARSQAQELLINGNFEAGDVGYGAPGYQVFGNGFTSAEYARTEGGKSFKAFAPYSQYAGSVGIQGGIAATPGQAYHLGGFLLSPTTDFISPTDFGLLELSFRDSTGAAIGAPIQQQFTSANTPDAWLPFAIDATAPANTVTAQVVIGYIQISAANPLGAVYYDDLTLTRGIVPAESNWIATGSGGWLSASNWQGGSVPNAVDAVANFGPSITSPSSVTIAGAGVTAGTVRFNNATSAYTVAGTGTLTLDVASGSAALTVTAGNHAINAPLVVNDSTLATVAAGQTLSLGGALTLNNGARLSAAGGGIVRVASTSVTGSSGASVAANGGTLTADVDLGNSVDVAAVAGEVRFNATQHVRSLTVAAGAKASLPDAASSRLVRTSSLIVDANGTLELGDNALVLDYTTSSPSAAVRAAIIVGKAGNFSGQGFTSANVAADGRLSIGYAEASAIGSPTTFLGEAGIDATTVLVRATLKGDATLDGAVNFPDLARVAQNYNGTNKVWSDGDFDYDGFVNFPDLAALAQNYNGSLLADQLAGTFGADFAADWALAQSLVPEPTTLAAIVAVTLGTRRRRAATE